MDRRRRRGALVRMYWLSCDLRAEIQQARGRVDSPGLWEIAQKLSVRLLNRTQRYAAM
jgi:hypothetical protein